MVKNTSNQDIEIKNEPAMRVASLWAKGLPFYETVPRAFIKLWKWMDSKGLPHPSGSPMGLAIYYDDPKAVAPQDVRFKVAVPVPQDTKLANEGDAAVEDMSAYQVAYTIVRGPYKSLDEVYSCLMAWIDQKGHSIIDAPREIYVKWGQGVPPEDWITEIQFPIKD